MTFHDAVVQSPVNITCLGIKDVELAVTYPDRYPAICELSVLITAVTNGTEVIYFHSICLK